MLRAARTRAVPWRSAAYPPQLAALDDAPALLLVRGEPSLLARPCVAIVGARAATAYGLAAASALAGDLAREGLVIVSGLARGIDAAAHVAALAAGGATVAVQACGPDEVYPPEHHGLAERIVREGALLTEFAPGTPPRAFHFPLRNRLISGLAAALVVVEARERSGSLITARHALDQGREVLAVPGPISTPTSVGPNRLLRDGARPALDADDVLLALGLPPRSRRPAGPARGAPSSPGARALLAALAHAPATRDELGRRLGRAPGELALALLELELEGRVLEERDGRLRAVEPR